MAERSQSYKVVCRGGLDSNDNFLELSNLSPGVATMLVNYEPSLYGGYRRINGFQPIGGEVDPDNAEGKIIGVAVFNKEIYTARKQQGSETYKFYKWDTVDWEPIDIGITMTSTNVDRFRYKIFNFDGTDRIIFVDGVNNAIVTDGTTWNQINPTVSDDGVGTEGNFGGTQVISAPKYVAVFKNTIFLAANNLFPNIVCYSAPSDEKNWSASAGGGQIPVGFPIQQIYPYRDSLYVFGETMLKEVRVEGVNFLLRDVATNIGCIAPDSVNEINGDIFFLSQDGVRPISSTQRIGDIELGSVSKNIQQNLLTLYKNNSPKNIVSVVVSSKSQLRLFYSGPDSPEDQSPGIIGGLKMGTEGIQWEWGELSGINASCATSGYIDFREYVLHGDYAGKVHRQESGDTFDGRAILSIYQTPYFDFSDPLIRKTLRKIMLFTRPEGDVSLKYGISFDYDSFSAINPRDYSFVSENPQVFYGEAVYNSDDAIYGGVSRAVLEGNVQGSGDSIRLVIIDSSKSSSFSIQGFLFEFSINGRI